MRIVATDPWTFVNLNFFVSARRNVAVGPNETPGLIVTMVHGDAFVFDGEAAGAMRAHLLAASSGPLVPIEPQNHAAPASADPSTPRLVVGHRPVLDPQPTAGAPLVGGSPDSC